MIISPSLLVKKIFVNNIIKSMPDDVSARFSGKDVGYLILCWRYREFAQNFDLPRCLGCKALLTNEQVSGIHNNKQYYCSRKCSHLNEESVHKRKATMKCLYGGEYSLSSPQLFAKMHATQLERYGKLQYNKDYTPKIKRTNEESNILRQNSMMAKYGVDHQMRSPEIKLKAILNRRKLEYYDKNQTKLRQNKNITIVSPRDEFKTKLEITFRCNVCGSVWTDTNINYQNTYCHNCFNRKLSKEELKVKDVIDKTHTSTAHYKPEFLGRKSLDVFVPDLNIAFEYNGGVWHSTKYNRKDINCHQFKTLSCLQHNIKLFQIFDFKWNFTRMSRIIEDILADYNEIYLKCDCLSDINKFNKQRCYNQVQSTYSFGCYVDNKLRAYAVIHADYHVTIISHNINCTKILVDKIKTIIKCFAIEINMDTESPLDYNYKTISINPPETYYYVSRYRVYNDINNVPKEELSKMYKIYGCGTAILTF